MRQHFYDWPLFEAAVRKSAADDLCNFDISFDNQTKRYIAECTNLQKYLYFLTFSIDEILQFIDLIREINPQRAQIFTIEYLTGLRSL